MRATGAWERFWFAEGSPSGLAAFRIGFALCLLREVETSRARSLGALSGGFHWAYTSWMPRFPEPWFDLIHSAQYPLIVLLAIGLATRSAALGLVVLQGAIFFADRLQFRNHPWFFLIVLALLACSPAGEALSLHAWRRKRAGRSAIARPLTWQRLIQVQVSIVYVFAALHKLHPAYLRGDVLRAWLDPAGARELAFLPALAAATVALEIGLAFALWWRPTRLVAVVAGVLFHATIAAALGAGAFSLALISSYILFFDPDDVAQLVAPWRGKSMKLGPMILLVSCLAPVPPARGEEPEAWVTVAERSGYESTSSYRETLDYLEALDQAHAAIRLVDFGLSAQGRRLPLVIVSSDGFTTPGDAARSAKPIVMVQSGIHAGEIDGKEASLMLLRDVALGRAGSWVEGLTLLVVPIYNVDGHEQVSPFHRPNQDGPRAGMGFRTTADGHDLNRDHLKLGTPEGRALSALIHAWRPHLHVDNHVTNGSDHGWRLTWTRAEAPQLAAPVEAWASEQMSYVVANTEKEGHRVGPYVELVDRDDPAAGIDSRVSEPRYATGYWPLLNRPSILIETHSSEPFRDRVRANYDFLRALLARVAATGPALVSAVSQAESRMVQLGERGAPPSRITLEWSGIARGDTINLRIHDWYHEPSTVLGEPLLHYRHGRVREIEAPWIHRPTPEVTVSRPRGYLILPGWPAIEQALSRHGLTVEILPEPVTLEVETMRIEELPAEEPGRTYQGLTRTSPLVERSLETQSFPAGTLWVRADQPDFEVAAHLLEPEAPDSLVRWGLLSQVVERKEYIDSRLLEKLARRMLEDDEDLEEEWEEALEDPTFAGDPSARQLWWYRRTPYWDETVGLMPVMRMLDDPDFRTLPAPTGTGLSP